MRALLIVLDSVGIGNVPDADRYGDNGANTLGHIIERMPDIKLPALDSLGLRRLVNERAGAHSPRETCVRMASPGRYRASYGRMQARSVGRDTTTGHWEIAGIIIEEPFAVFERFPDALVNAIEHEAGVHFIGNYARSGTTLLEELGAEHVRTANPIFYTSVDSVLQIAAHEEVVPIQRLYEICVIARRHADAARIGRVIARPFEGEAGKFRRTSRRHDYSMKPPRSVLNALSESGVEVIGVGKISDIFAGEGVTQSYPAASNAEGMQRIAEL